MNKNEDVKNLAQSVLKEHQTKKQGRQFILWILHTRSSTRFSPPSLRQVSGLRCISG